MGRPGWAKVAHFAMVQAGIPVSEIPEDLKERILYKSKRGPLGQIVVRKMSGVAKSQAVEAVRKFAKIIGSKEELAEKLLAVEADLNLSEKKLLELLQIKSSKALPHLFAEAGVEPTKILSLYAKACVYLGQVESAIEAQRGMPAVVRSLVKLAVAKTGVCTSCGGLGKVPVSARGIDQKFLCPDCEGAGQTEYTSKHFEFASGKLLELSGLLPKNGPLVNVNTQINTKIGGSGRDFFEKVVHTSDALLYSKKREEEPPIEAEVAPVP